MKQQRLCEVKDAMRTPLISISGGFSDHDGHPLVQSWSQLKCPFTQHCDKSGPCRGFTAENRQRISELDDVFFKHGFVHTTE
jgi:hypothetical protein